MSEIVPDEGLDYLVNLVLKQGTPPANLYMGLFIGGTQTTVPAASATLATPGGTFAEAAYTGYGRVTIPSADWGATGAKTVWSQTGRGSTAAQKSFAAATATYGTQVNGFFICTVASGTAGVVLLWSNFDDSTGIASLAIGDVVRVTPTYALLN